jgi:hypothetical protein
MKNIILLALLVTLVTVSCKQKSTETTTTEISVSDTTKITNEPTTVENGTTMMKKDTVIVQKVTKKVVAEKIYSCPMHPEVQGKLNSKCSKCGMPLTEPVS